MLPQLQPGGAPPKPEAEQGRAGATTGSDHPDPPRAQRESPCLPEVPCERSARSRGAHPKPKRSRVEPEQALEAITLFPRAQRESPSFPELTCERSARPRGAHPNPQRSGVGPEQALEAITLIPRAQRESPSFLELTCERSARPRGANARDRYHSPHEPGDGYRGRCSP
jgi:hypothetical protein